MNIRHKFQLFKYYMNIDAEHHSSFIRIISDILFINIAIWVLVYLWIVYRTKSPLLSALISLAAVGLLDVMIYIRKHKIYVKNREKRRKESVVNHLSHRIRLLNVEEFQLQLIKILLNCKGFSNIKEGKGLLTAEYYDRPVAIGFHHPPPGEKTPFLKIWEFVHLAKNLGFEQGFFFTSSSFDENCDEEKIKPLGFSICLMDFSYIMDRMEEAGMFPDEDTIDQLIEGEIQREKNNKQKLKKQILNQYKSRQYLKASILFLAGGILFRSSRLYYLIVALFFASLTLIIKLLSLKSSYSSDDS